MRNFLIKLSKFFLNLIIVLGVIISIANFVLQLLPQDISQPVLNWLNTSLEILLPYGISSLITSVVLAVAKYSNVALKVALKDSDRKQELQRKQLEESYNHQLEMSEKRDLAIVELINHNTQVLKDISEQNKYIIEYDKILAQKNISSSIIPERYKILFKNWSKKLDNGVINDWPQIEVSESKEKTSIEAIDSTIDNVIEERELI